MRSVWTVVVPVAPVAWCTNQLPVRRAVLVVFFVASLQAIVGETTASRSEGAVAVPEFKLTANTGSTSGATAGMGGAFRQDRPSTSANAHTPGFGAGSVAAMNRLYSPLTFS